MRQIYAEGGKFFLEKQGVGEKAGVFDHIEFTLKMRGEYRLKTAYKQAVMAMNWL